MHNLLRCRRGSVALATVIALVPLIGVVALGAEAGSWYVTRQHAQNAADAAAYSGALRLACSIPGSCDQAQDLFYRGKQFADQNGFCDPRDTSYSCANSPPTGTTQRVDIDQPTASRVRARVSQQQPAYLAAVLGLSTVNIPAQAIAEVVTLANPCVLSLTDPVHFQGSTTVTSPNCGLASNSRDNNSIDFTGNGLNVSNAGSISALGGCAQTGGTQCSKAITYAAAPVPNPLSGLDAPMLLLSLASFANGKCPSAGNPSPTAYGPATKCVNDGFTFKSNGGPTGNGNYPLNGVYFFSGALKIQSSTLTGTATLILLPGASLSITGGPIIQLTALDSVSTTQVPDPPLASVVNLMSKLLIYDPETTTGNQTVTISGNSSSYFNGITYAPNASVTYQGSTQSYGCVQVIAKGVTLSGNSNFDNTTCPEILKPKSTYVRMVQ